MHNLSFRLVPPQMAVYEKAQGHWISAAIYTACELELADHLSDSVKNIHELARSTQTDPKYLYRLMRALAGEGIFREHDGMNFSNTRLSKAMMEGEQSSKYLVLHQFNYENKVYLKNLTGRIREGREKGAGKTQYELMSDDPVRSEIYNKSMDQSSGMMALAVLSAYDFSGIRTLIDIGGGRGVLLSHILEAYPGMRGVLFDLPHVSGPLRENLPKNDEGERVKVIAGDFFVDMPPAGDLYLMKNILHGFQDEDCIKLLRKIREVMAPEGKILILETIIRPDNQPAFGKMFDLQMMVGTEGGKERSREEFDSLFKVSGLKINRIIRTVAPFSIIEAVRKER